MDSIFEIKIDASEPSYLELFNNLLNGIDQQMQTNLPEAERYQNCFWISVKYHKKLKKIVLKNGFANDKAEIEFFREINPKFTCFIEFFVIATDALWFVNNKVSGADAFWKEEVEKYTRFCKRYSSFIRYYKSGDRTLDNEYFLQETADHLSDIHSKMFDEAPPLHSSKDWLVRSYFAHRMYFRFVKNKIDKFRRQFRKTNLSKKKVKR